MIRTTLDTLLTSRPRPFREDGELSAMVKEPVTGPAMLGPYGFEGNQVADMLHHGGIDKAVHLYSIEHYEFWRKKYPDVSVLDKPGAFGENISCAGMTEDTLCLGDVFCVGGAVIQCTHARQPCWKLNHHFGQPDVLKTVVETTKSGSYFSVLKAGLVKAGDSLFQIDRIYPEWPLKRLFRIIIGGGHKGQGAALMELSQLPVLGETWRKRALMLAEKA